LAEVLITLGIIGVVAAITMPTLIAKHQKQVTVQRLKKVYSVLGQMVMRTYADNGPVSDFLQTGETVDADKTKEFFETYWFPYFNEPMVVKHLYPRDLIYDIKGNSAGISVYTDYSVGRVLFSTQDGTIYNVWVMGWSKNDEGNNVAQYTNNQLIYVDINGLKGPNRYGKDIFRFFINFNNNVVKSDCDNYIMTDINQNCNNSGICCSGKIIKDGWQITDTYPW